MINLPINIASIIKKIVYSLKTKHFLQQKTITLIVANNISKLKVKTILQTHFPIKIKKINSLIIKKPVSRNKHTKKITVIKRKSIKIYKKIYIKLY